MKKVIKAIQFITLLSLLWVACVILLPITLLVLPVTIINEVAEKINKLQMPSKKREGQQS